ncbi:MAG: BspA family leucine-rich repeat surface protein, partial [Allomuricauda sp.]
PPNTAPVIKAQTFNAAENISDATIIGTVTATDADKGDKLTFSIATNSGDLFEITNAGALSLATGKTLDFDTKKQHVLSVSVSDGKATAKADVTIKVTEVVAQNQPPVIEAQGFEAAEDIADTDVIGTVVASDPEQDALTFSISTNDNDIFEIDASSGELSLAEGKTLDFETAESHPITVAVTDGNGSATATITINVADIPEIEAQSFEAPEDIADTDVIGTIVVPNATFTISVNDNDLFEIDASSGELSLVEGKALDFETADEHSITVMATNGNGSTEATITITVTNVVESLADDPASFVTTWVTTANNETIVIGVNESLTYNYTIDWGDGTVEDITDGTVAAQHEYAQPGTHTVARKGIFPAIYMDVNGGLVIQADALKLASIEQWGTNPWTTMYGAFKDCGNMVYNATDVPNLSQVTNMSGMFNGADAFNGDLSDWDVSNVTNMGYMFFSTDSFNGDISGWDVSSVTNMSYMFAYTDAFNGNISGWDVSNVTNMSYMFRNAGAFNGDLSGWDVSNVTNMIGMFNSTDVFEGIGLSGWNTINVTDMSGMFGAAEAFNGDLSGWDVSNVIYMGDMFNGAVAFNGDISGWDTGSVIVMAGMFYQAYAFNRNLGAWDISSIDHTTGGMGYMLSYSGLSTANYSSTLEGWANPNAPQNITLDAEAILYCDNLSTAAALNYLTNDKGWTINDGGFVNCN